MLLNLVVVRFTDYMYLKDYSYMYLKVYVLSYCTVRIDALYFAIDRDRARGRGRRGRGVTCTGTKFSSYMY